MCSYNKQYFNPVTVSSKHDRNFPLLSAACRVNRRSQFRSSLMPNGLGWPEFWNFCRAWNKQHPAVFLQHFIRPWRQKRTERVVGLHGARLWRRLVPCCIPFSHFLCRKSASKMDPPI